MKQLSMSLLAVAVLVGCHSSVPDLSQVLPADASPAMRELMLAERRWQSVRPQEYEFTVDIMVADFQRR